MLDTIKSILNSDMHPMLPKNLQGAHIYLQYLNSTDTVAPIYRSIYNVEFQQMPYCPSKAKYYFRLIHNDITQCLNQYYKEAQTQPSVDSVEYWHYSFQKLIAELITHFQESIKLQNLSLQETLKVTDYTNGKETEIYTLICYYAIAMLAACYMQWLNIFESVLPPNINRPTTPQEFIFDTLQIEFTQEIQIIDPNAPKLIVNDPNLTINNTNIFNAPVGNNISNIEKYNQKQK
ncbi:MAG: hypothetical protein IJ756_07080 [Paludibacteraceae bacterium]|nr:hypothetical protein [Paludibacteraceae bacterium]